MNILLRLLPLSALLTLILAGCASQPQKTASTSATTTSAAPVPADVTGNWAFNVQLPSVPVPPSGPITLPTNPVEGVSGSLTSTNGSVTGILHARPLALPNCVSSSTDLPTTGTVDASGNLILTTALAGGTATINANVVTLGTTTFPNGLTRTGPFYAGTYQVVGGSCAQPSIALTIYSVPNVSGTYTGTMMQILFPSANPPLASITVAAVLTQAATPNADGEYPLSGTITATGDCNTTVNFTQGLVIGDSLSTNDLPASPIVLSPSGPLGLGTLSGSIVPASTKPTILATLLIPTGCRADSFNGILNAQ
jgi:hypothetical protein